MGLQLGSGSGFGKGIGHSQEGRGLHTGIQDFGEKSVISLTEWANTQGDSVTDDGIRSHTAWMPSAPTRPVLNIFPIPLVKSDFETRPESLCAIPAPFGCALCPSRTLPQIPTAALFKEIYKIFTCNRIKSGV